MRIESDKSTDRICHLKTFRLPLGLLINFNVPFLKDGIKRIVLSGSLGDLGVLAVSFGGPQ